MGGAVGTGRVPFVAEFPRAMTAVSLRPPLAGDIAGGDELGRVAGLRSGAAVRAFACSVFFLRGLSNLSRSPPSATAMPRAASALERDSHDTTGMDMWWCAWYTLSKNLRGENRSSMLRGGSSHPPNQTPLSRIVRYGLLQVVNKSAGACGASVRESLVRAGLEPATTRLKAEHSTD